MDMGILNLCAMSWLQLIRNTPTLEHARNTKTYHVGLISVKFFTVRTIVAEPLSGDLCEVVKTIILARRANILGTVKNKLGEILNSSKSGYNPNLTVCMSLQTLS